MSIKCRLCGSPISSSPLLELNNMPKSAQSFVKEDELDSEKGVDIILYQCENCGLVQATGEPVPYYKDVIRATSVSGEMRSFRLEQFGSFIENFDLHGKRILEVGAGTGDYLSIMSEINPETYGLEHNEESVQVQDTVASDGTRIIGFKDFTAHAGATSLIYMLQKQLSKNYYTISSFSVLCCDIKCTKSDTY